MDLTGPEALLPRARAGDPAAQFELSEIYAWGVPQNFKASERWLRRAAEAGYAPAQLDLGSGLGLGSGATGRLPLDRVEGLMWLIVASRPGADPQGLAASFAMVLRREMPAAQIAAAEQRAQARLNRQSVKPSARWALQPYLLASSRGSSAVRC